MATPSRAAEPVEVMRRVFGPFDAASFLRPTQTSTPPTTRIAPTAVSSAYLTVSDGLGSSATTSSPSPNAIARPTTNVVSRAASAKAVVRSPGRGPAAISRSAAISDGLTQSGNAIATTATTRPSTPCSSAARERLELGDLLGRQVQDHLVRPQFGHGRERDGDVLLREEVAMLEH